MRKALVLGAAIVTLGSASASSAAHADSPSWEAARSVLEKGAGAAYDGSSQRSASSLDAGLTVSGVYSDSAASLEKSSSQSDGSLRTRAPKTARARRGARGDKGFFSRHPALRAALAVGTLAGLLGVVGVICGAPWTLIPLLFFVGAIMGAATTTQTVVYRNGVRVQ